MRGRFKLHHNTKTESAPSRAHAKNRIVTRPTITLPAFAKINLNLRVVDQRADGYHDLDTSFQTISLHDTIKFTPTETPDLVLSSDDGSLRTDEQNLILRAAKALRDRFATNRGVRIRVEKRIPLQAGLGGGSSDAAVTLIALSRLWEVTATTTDLIDIGSSLGADVPFFLFGGTARGRGIGDNVTPLPDAPEKFLLIIKPNPNIRTSDAYKVLDERSLTTRNSKSILSSSQPTEILDNADFDALQNDFEEIAFELEPEILRAKVALINVGAGGTLLAGSGSAVFGTFNSEDAQRRAIQAIELETGWRVFPCKTVGRDDYARAFASFVSF